VDFYAHLGPPAVGQGAAWLFAVHALVNHKLNRQRTETFLKSRPTWPPEVREDLLTNCDALASQPTMEVVMKRFIVNRDEPIAFRGLTTALLAIVMGLGSGTSGSAALSRFVFSISEAVELSGQENMAQLITLLNLIQKMIKEAQDFDTIRSFIELQKYAHVIGPNGPLKDAREATNLIQAGTCVKGTCA